MWGPRVALATILLLRLEAFMPKPARKIRFPLRSSGDAELRAIEDELNAVRGAREGVEREIFLVAHQQKLLLRKSESGKPVRATDLPAERTKRDPEPPREMLNELAEDAEFRMVCELIQAQTGIEMLNAVTGAVSRMICA